jgi:hypothetical protein
MQGECGNLEIITEGVKINGHAIHFKITACIIEDFPADKEKNPGYYWPLSSCRQKRIKSTKIAPFSMVE